MRKRGSLHIGAILLGGLMAAMFFAAGCGETGPKKVTIAVIPKGTAHEFWQTVHAGALQASKDFDVKIEWQGPQTEIQRDLQIEIVENFIAKMVDAIALAPQDADALLPVIKRVNKNNIPLVLFDSDANTEDYVSFVATDNYEGGVKAAQALAELLGNKGKVIVIANEPGSGSTDKREQGFKDAIAKNFPEIEIVDMQYGNSDRARARAVTEDLLTRNPNVDGIFASCEPMTFGAWQALRAQDLAGKKKLVGFRRFRKIERGPACRGNQRAGFAGSISYGATSR